MKSGTKWEVGEYIELQQSFRDRACLFLSWKTYFASQHTVCKTERVYLYITVFYPFSNYLQLFSVNLQGRHPH